MELLFVNINNLNVKKKPRLWKTVEGTRSLGLQISVKYFSLANKPPRQCNKSHQTKLEDAQD